MWTSPCGYFLKGLTEYRMGAKGRPLQCCLAYLNAHRAFVYEHTSCVPPMLMFGPAHFCLSVAQMLSTVVKNGPLEQTWGLWITGA